MTCRVQANPEEARLARLVAAGGGEWVGVQHIKGREALILFNVPSGTTLSLPVGQVTAEAVARRIKESREETHASK